MLELSGVKVRTRITLEKVDVSGDVPVLVETITVEDGRVVERIPGPAAPQES